MANFNFNFYFNSDLFGLGSLELIATLEGIIEHKYDEYIIINVAGVGYEVSVSPSTLNRLPPESRNTKLYVVETSGIYGGGTNLYGFLNAEEKEIFLTFKDGLKNTGAKKALDYLDKAVKSLPDFRRAVIEKNIKVLTSIFGFHSKTAEKIMVLLQDKLSSISVVGEEKWAMSSAVSDFSSDAVSALISLGYSQTQAKHAVEEALSQFEGSQPTTETLIKVALKHLR
ncbi:MAG: Holliday junction branch migration protein RuvA [Elusimicrobiota bacterium]